MITLKPLILDPTGWLEATWVEQTKAADTIIPAKEALFDAEGVEQFPAEPERIEEGVITESQVKCHSYPPTQIDMLREDAALLGTSLDAHEAQLGAWVAAYVPPASTEQPPTPEVVESPLEKLQAFLTANPDVAAMLQ